MSELENWKPKMEELAFNLGDGLFKEDIEKGTNEIIAFTESLLEQKKKKTEQELVNALKGVANVLDGRNKHRKNFEALNKILDCIILSN